MTNASVFDDLREAIATGEIAPGESLVEADVMARFGAGRPAVRVALGRLEQEGLIEQRPNRSARVRVVPPEEALEIAELRSMLEQRAAARAATRATAADIDELRQILAEAAAAPDGSGGLAADADRRLHTVILRIAGDRTVLRMHATLHGHLVRFHIRTRVEQTHAATSEAEHAAIVEAIAAHDSGAAAEAMRRHLDRLGDVLRSSVADTL